MSKKNIAVLGAGKMGLGIAQLFATKGHQVKVIYVYDDKIRCDAAAVVRSNLSVLVENDVMTQQEADDAAARISFVDTIEEVADFADIVFEGIIEKLEINSCNKYIRDQYHRDCREIRTQRAYHWYSLLESGLPCSVSRGDQDKICI